MLDSREWIRSQEDELESTFSSCFERRRTPGEGASRGRGRERGEADLDVSFLSLRNRRGRRFNSTKVTLDLSPAWPSGMFLLPTRLLLDI